MKRRFLLFLATACVCSAAPIATVDEVSCTASIREIVHHSIDTRSCAQTAGIGGSAFASNVLLWEGNHIEIGVQTRVTAVTGTIWDEEQGQYVPHSTKAAALSAISVVFQTAGQVREGIARYQFYGSVVRGMDGGGYAGDNCDQSSCVDSGEFPLLIGTTHYMDIKSGAFAGDSVGGGAEASAYYSLAFFEVDGITPVQIVPEPSTWALGAMGLLALCGYRRLT